MKYNPSRGGHAPGHLRNQLIDYLEGDQLLSGTWSASCGTAMTSCRAATAWSWTCRSEVPMRWRCITWLRWNSGWTTRDCQDCHDCHDCHVWWCVRFFP